MANLTLAVISALKQSAPQLKHYGKRAVVEQALHNNGSRPLMLTLIALSAALLQQTPAPPSQPETHARFMVMGADGPGGLDKDGDGQITQEEFAAPMTDHFARMDANSDGRLSTEELTAGHGAMAGGDHDVMIVRGPGGHGEGGEREVRIIGGPGGHGGPGMRRFEMRRPHPGGEAGAHAEHGEGRTMVFVGGEPGADGERQIVIHGGPGGHAMMAGAHAEGSPGERIEIRRVGGPGGEHDLDADNDGKISEAEFSAPLREAFARMDADRSGFIEAGERGSGHGSEVFVHRVETRQNDED
ncbi:MAG: hypothetical protein RL093_1334 [Pseudomonadota bacterium]